PRTTLPSSTFNRRFHPLAPSTCGVERPVARQAHNRVSSNLTPQPNKPSGAVWSGFVSNLPVASLLPLAQRNGIGRASLALVNLTELTPHRAPWRRTPDRYGSRENPSHGQLDTR